MLCAFTEFDFLSGTAGTDAVLVKRHGEVFFFNLESEMARCDDGPLDLASP
jgi:hypothetical protein